MPAPSSDTVTSTKRPLRSALRRIRVVVLAMINGIFQHIEHYLLNEHSIHVRKQNVVAQIHVHFDIRKVLLKLDGRFGQHVLHDFGFHVQRGCFALNAGDGQLIFNHAQKPLGIGVDIGQQLALLFRAAGRYRG